MHSSWWDFRQQGRSYFCALPSISRLIMLPLYVRRLPCCDLMWHVELAWMDKSRCDRKYLGPCFLPTAFLSRDGFSKSWAREKREPLLHKLLAILLCRNAQKKGLCSARERLDSPIFQFIKLSSPKPGKNIPVQQPSDERIIFIYSLLYPLWSVW